MAFPRIARYRINMTDGLDLDALSELERAATPGPWHVRFLDDDHAMNAIGISTEPDTDKHQDMATWNSAGPELLAATLIQAPPCVVAKDGCWQQNADLIVTVRNALPELIRLARRGRDAIALESLDIRLIR